RFAGAWAGAFLFAGLVYVGVNLLAPYAQDRIGWHVFGRYQREGAFPSRQLAEEITRRWHAKVGAPLAFVIGSKWVAGHVGFFSDDHPLVLRDGSLAECPWADLDEVGRRGSVVVWDPGEDRKTGGRYPGWLADASPQQRFPSLEVQAPILL